MPLPAVRSRNKGTSREYHSPPSKGQTPTGEASTVEVDITKVTTRAVRILCKYNQDGGIFSTTPVPWTSEALHTLLAKREAVPKNYWRTHKERNAIIVEAIETMCHNGSLHCNSQWQTYYLDPDILKKYKSEMMAPVRTDSEKTFKERAQEYQVEYQQRFAS